MGRRFHSRGILVASAVLVGACSGAGGNTSQGATSGGTPGVGGGTTTGITGSSDGGTSSGNQTPDGGTPGSLSVNLPSSAAGWTFYGPANGAPQSVYGASYDEGGNLWVAGGEEGLFVLRAGETKFQKFTMADGLRPYGYMFDGSVPPGDKYLKVISVSGGPAGTAFVGYAGKPPTNGALDCESNWDGPNPDPSIYKSGDADKVTLNGNGIQVVHYDISSGPGLVGHEMRGREKICTILRIRYDKLNNKVWFGGNHGFAMGDPDYQGTQNCQWDSTPNPPTPTSQTSPFDNEPGHFGCSGVLEHVHPAISGYHDNTSATCCALLTGNYYGVSVDPVTKDVWFGGLMRTTKFHFGSNAGNYYKSQSETEDPPYISNRIDVWPDAVTEPNYPRPSDRVDDAISGAAAMNDGTVWLSSFAHGLAHLDSSGGVTTRLSQSDGLVSTKLASIAADPIDQSVWTGASYAGGISRLSGGSFTNYGLPVLGNDLVNTRISDIQAGPGPNRQIVVSFQGDATHAGAVGVYSGD